MKLSAFCLIALLLSGCQRSPTLSRLETIRSLVWCAPDSALSLLEGLPGIPSDAEERALYGLLQAQLYYRTSRPLKDASLIETSVRHYESLSPLHPLLPEVLLYQGLKRMELGNKEAGIHLLNRAARLVTDDTDPRPVSQLYNNLFLSARMSGNYDAALRYYRMAQHYATLSGRDDWFWQNAVSILNTPHYLSDTIAARALIDTILVNLPHVSSSTLRSRALNNVGWYHEQTDRPEAAERYYRLCIEQSDSLSPRTWLNLLAVLERNGKSEEADSLLEASVHTADIAFNTEMHRQLAIRSIHQKQPAQALNHLNQYVSGIRDYYIRLQTDNVAAIQQRYDLLAAENRHLKQYRSMQLSLSAVIGSLVCAGLLYRHYTRVRLHRLKVRMTQLYRKLRDSLTASEAARKVIMEEAGRLTTELATKDAQLKRWEVLFGSTSANSILEPRDVRALTFYIKTKYLQQTFTEDDEGALERWLDLTDNDFACRLTTAHPSLGKTERNTVYLVRLGMDIEELSCTFDRSAQTIRQRIYRICIKMGIPTDVRHFIRAIRKY